MNDRRCSICQGRGSTLRLVGRPSRRNHEQVPCLGCGGSGWIPSPGDAMPPVTKQPWNEGANATRDTTTGYPPGPIAPPKPMHMPGPEPHFHTNRLGILEACYHRCKEINWRTLAVSMFLFTVSFPAEHLLWERAPLFSELTKWMGL